MPRLSDMSVRTLQPPNYRFTDAVQAVQIEKPMLEDFVIDFERSKTPVYRSATANDLLQLNDVVIGVEMLGINRMELTAVGLYHPALPTKESVTLGPRTLAFRALNLSEATSILAALIYRLERRSDLLLSAVRQMPVPLLTGEQVGKFLDLIKTTHEMSVNARKRSKLMKELIPATIHKFVKDNE